LPHSQTFLQIMMHIRQPNGSKNRLFAPSIAVVTIP